MYEARFTRQFLRATRKEDVEAVREACQEIEDRQARKRREEQKASLIQRGLAEISGYLWQLNQDGEITAEKYLDSTSKQACSEQLRPNWSALCPANYPAKRPRRKLKRPSTRSLMPNWNNPSLEDIIYCLFCCSCDNPSFAL